MEYDGCVDEDGRHFSVKCKGVKEIWHELGMEHVEASLRTSFRLGEYYERFFSWSTIGAIIGASRGQICSGLHHLVALVEQHK
jgi:hypothetical protein